MESWNVAPFWAGMDYWFAQQVTPVPPGIPRPPSAPPALPEPATAHWVYFSPDDAGSEGVWPDA